MGRNTVPNSNAHRDGYAYGDKLSDPYAFANVDANNNLANCDAKQLVNRGDNTANPDVSTNGNTREVRFFREPAKITILGDS